MNSKPRPVSPAVNHGLLVLEKPADYTSRDVVNIVQRIVRPLKVGHAGTLDPLAQGVLVVCLGRATRLIDFVHRFSKRYLGTFRLGCSSDTEDITGELTELPHAPHPTETQIQAVIPRFLGEISQRPPAYSALKVDGKRAYRLARKGAELDLAPRMVNIHRLDVVRYAYPHLTLDIECGTGTYIRSLGRDLAESLGTSAVMTELIRESIGPFLRADAVDVREITADRLWGAVRASRFALGDIPDIEVTKQEADWLKRGQFVTRILPLEQSEATAISDQGELLAVLARKGGHEWRPAVNFMADSS